jgi:hypothetical protein
MKQFDYKVEIISTYKLQTTLDDMGRNGWELVTTSIKESKKEGFEKILLIFKRDR